MENKAIERLKTLVDVYNTKITQTTTNKNQFEINCRSEFNLEHLSDRLEFISEHFDMIGKEVYKYVKNETYVLVSDIPLLGETHLMFNKLGAEPLIFTIEMFNNFLKCYVDFQIDYLTRTLLENSITSNSSDKLRNLVFEWELECKQELLGIYKNISKNC